MAPFSNRLFVILSVLLLITTILNPAIKAVALDGQNESLTSNESDFAAAANAEMSNQSYLPDLQSGDNLSAIDHVDLPGDSSKANGTGLSGKDSDGDGLDDDSEARLGTNPYSMDSDRNGVLDAREKYTRSFKNVSAGVEATICGEGDIGKNLTIGKEDKPSPLVNSLKGVYKIAEVTPHVNISWAYVKIYYDPSELSDPSNYSMFLFDSNKNSIEPVEEHGVNIEEHYFWGNLSQLSGPIVPFVATPLDWFHDWWVDWKKPEQVIKSGEQINVKVKVHNSGSASASNVNVNLEVSNNLGQSSPIGTTTVPVIPAGSSATASIGWTVQPGMKTVHVTVDPSNLIVETDEGNNAAWKDFDKYLDSDGDGLTDYEEINGMRRAFPEAPVTTDPTRWDTDGDGLSDGMEMGVIIREDMNRQYYYSIMRSYSHWPWEWNEDDYPYDGYHYDYISNPNLQDSDFDGSNDREELAAGTNPLVANGNSAVTEFMLGFLFGDLISDDPSHGNIPFFTGNIVAGLCPLWEWVNMGEGVVGYGSDGDVPMATVTAATGLVSFVPIPLIIDELPEIGAKSARFAAHHPNVVGEAAHFLVNTLGDYAIEPLKFLYGDSARILCDSRGLTNDYLKVLADCKMSTKVLDDLADTGVTIRTVFKDTRGAVVRVEKSGLKGEIRYIDDGSQLLADLGLTGRSKAEIGEIVGGWCLGENGANRAVGFVKRNAYQQGPDDIVIENAEDFIVANEFDDVQTLNNILSIAEYKFFTRGENYVIDANILKKNSLNQRQLSTDWITGSFDRLSNQNRLTNELRQDIQTAINDQTLGRKLVIVENAEVNGLSVNFESLKNEGVTEFYIVKIGGIM